MWHLGQKVAVLSIMLILLSRFLRFAYLVFEYFVFSSKKCIMSASIPTSPATPMVSPGLRLPALNVVLQQLPSSPSIGAMQPPGSPKSEATNAPLFSLSHLKISGNSGLSGDRSDHSGLMSAPHFSLSSAHFRDDFEYTPLHSLSTPGHASSGRSHASATVQNRSSSL